MSHRVSRRRGALIIRRSASLVLLLTLILPVANAIAAPTSQPEVATVVRCNPTTAIGVIAGPGNNPPPVDAVVDLYIEDVVGLYGVDLRIASFDTAIAQVLDQLPAAGVQIQPLDTFLQPDFIVRNTADNTAGTVRYAATQVAPTQPVTGSGPIARITFRGLQAGTFVMTWGTIELSDINGGPIPFTAQPCTVTFSNPLAVTLASFEATAQSDHILVAWETTSEIGNRGFNLYRGMTPNAPEQRLNDTLIPSGSTGSGQGYAYTWPDFDVAAGNTYYYWLETVSISGANQMYGPVDATYLGPTAVALSDLSAGNAAPQSHAVAPGLLLLAMLIPLALAAVRRQRQRA